MLQKMLETLEVMLGLNPDRLGEKHALLGVCPAQADHHDNPKHPIQPRFLSSCIPVRSTGSPPEQTSSAREHRHAGARMGTTVMHVKFDASLAKEARQTVMRACSNQVELIRFVNIAGTQQVKMSLCLQTTAVKPAMEAITQLAPNAEFGRIVALPEQPSPSWLDVSQHASEEARKSNVERLPSLAQLFSPEEILLYLDVVEKSHLFGELGRFFSRKYGLSPTLVASRLSEREALGSTGLGQGVAIPHARILGLSSAHAVYIRLKTAMPFEAPDGKPVTDIVALLMPEQAPAEHLQLLAQVAQLFAEPLLRKQLKLCTDRRSIYKLLAEHAGQAAAGGGAQ